MHYIHYLYDMTYIYFQFNIDKAIEFIVYFLYTFNSNHKDTSYTSHYIILYII